MPFEHANASPVTDQLWTGGQLAIRDRPRGRRQLDELVAAGLTHIVDVRAEWDDSMFVNLHAPEVRYHWIGIDDFGQTIRDPWWEAATAIVRSALSDPTSRVLVHCAHGVQRGPSLTFATLISSGWSPTDALDAIVTARPVARALYAEDALDWRLRKSGLSDVEADQVRAELAAWRASHPHNSDEF